MTRGLDFSSIQHRPIKENRPVVQLLPRLLARRCSINGVCFSSTQVGYIWRTCLRDQLRQNAWRQTRSTGGSCRGGTQSCWREQVCSMWRGSVWLTWRCRYSSDAVTSVMLYQKRFVRTVCVYINSDSLNKPNVRLKFSYVHDQVFQCFGRTARLQCNFTKFSWGRA